MADALRSCFDQFDADGSGEISRAELVKAVENCPCAKEESWDHDKVMSVCATIMAQADGRDKDGKISWDEFKAAFDGSE